MFLSELICTLGLMAPQSCLPADSVEFVNAVVCDKHDTDPASLPGQSKSQDPVMQTNWIEQPCKAEQKP